MVELQKNLYGDKSCPDKDDSQTSSSLTLRSFQALFIFSGACSVGALFLDVVRTYYRAHGSNSASRIPSNTPDNDEPTMPVGSTGDTGSPPEGEENPGRDLFYAERESYSLIRGHRERPILSHSGSSLRRRQIELSNEQHGELIALEEDRSL
jgi:hypothetical protein